MLLIKEGSTVHEPSFQFSTIGVIALV